MNLALVNEVTKSQLKTDIPAFRSGSTVRVHVKIKEPIIDHIEVVRHGKVRRNKLSYLRNRSGKAARLKEVR